MATNSAGSKGWAIALVSAVLVIVADKGQPNYALIAAIPAVLFLLLDTYYLALERSFIAAYNEFIDKLHKGEVASRDLYAVAPAGAPVKAFFGAFTSFSIWPFYTALGLMIAAAMLIVIPAVVPGIP